MYNICNSNGLQNSLTNILVNIFQNNFFYCIIVNKYNQYMIKKATKKWTIYANKIMIVCLGH